MRIVDHQAIEVEGHEAQVLTEDAKTESIVGVDVDLADLAVPATRPQGLQAELDVTASQGVQHHINTLSVGCLHQSVVPILAV